MLHASHSTAMVFLFPCVFVCCMLVTVLPWCFCSRVCLYVACYYCSEYVALFLRVVCFCWDCNDVCSCVCVCVCVCAHVRVCVLCVPVCIHATAAAAATAGFDGTGIPGRPGRHAEPGGETPGQQDTAAAGPGAGGHDIGHAIQSAYAGAEHAITVAKNHRTLARCTRWSC